MPLNYSPWIHQLHKTRKVSELSEDKFCDIAIVGAGIAGLSTAFWLMKYTQYSVCVIERGRLGHGATGHNAGQITCEIERPFSDLVSDFGLETVCKTVADLEKTGFELIDELFDSLGKTTRLQKITGYDGFSDCSMFERILETNRLRREGGIAPAVVHVLEGAEINQINFFKKQEDLSEYLRLVSDEKYEGLFITTTLYDIQEKLHTKRVDMLGYIEGKRSVANSARMCEEIAEFCEGAYGDRFCLVEDTNVSKIVFHDEGTIIDCGEHTVSAPKTVLCTNGFKNFTLVNQAGLELDKGFHKNIREYKGTMAGYLQKGVHDPFALSFLTDAKQDYMDEEFFYITRRPFDHDEEDVLVTVGGPGELLEEDVTYSRDDDHNSKHLALMDDFLEKTFIHESEIKHQFLWHGLMGYTKSGVRMVGQDPLTKNLYYNLGCNGIGLLHSIYGGRRLARLLNNEQVEKSMFDVPIFYAE